MAANKSVRLYLSNLGLSDLFLDFALLLDELIDLHKLDEVELFAHEGNPCVVDVLGVKADADDLVVDLVLHLVLSDWLQPV